MYYDASSTDYISTPSFAIPNTGILTVEMWMKSQFNATSTQTLLGDNFSSTTEPFIYIYRALNSNHLRYRYVDGSIAAYLNAINFFLDLDNQYIHITIVCDYNNKTGKFYRNGIQFGTTTNLSGTPVFPLTNRIKYIGAYGLSSNAIVDGSLDEVRIYNRGLSADEVAAIYNQTKGKY
jgi:energy-converting hydrogenase Eha subunit F